MDDATDTPKKTRARSRKTRSTDPVADVPAAAPSDPPAPAKPKKTPKPLIPDVGSEDVPVHPWATGFVVQMMDRRELAEYELNPRAIEPDAAHKLYDELEENGLVEPAVVFNKRNRQIVGGHQRLRMLDRRHKSKVYRLPVCVVDLDEDQHAQVCIALNNPQAAGSWDLTLLSALIKRPGVKLKATGFDVATVYQLFGTDGATMKQSDDAMALSAAMEKAAERMTNIKKLADKTHSLDFYRVLIFASTDQAVAADDAFGFPPGQVFNDGIRFLNSYLDFLASRGSDANRNPEEVAICCARIALEFANPEQPGYQRVMTPEGRAVLTGYAQQLHDALQAQPPPA